MGKVALITGVTGQDGSYLADFLLDKGYEVHGIKRRSSSINTERVDHLFEEVQDQRKPFYLHHGDMTDSLSLMNIVDQTRPDEIYNLAAQSHVKVSFEEPEYTANADAIGPLRLLESIRLLGLIDKTRFYQASTSELYGNAPSPQNEVTPFQPRSPYGVAKLYAHWITVNYRESYGMYACNGILFNHESPRRGETFISRKITLGLIQILRGIRDTLYVGNLDAKRDWGHAKDYVEMQWKMLQQNTPRDFVIATGYQTTVRDFINRVAVLLEMRIVWEGSGIEEKAFWINGPNEYKSDKPLIKVDPRYFRPAEVESLLGDSKRAREVLGWLPRHDLDSLIADMVESDLKKIKIPNS